MDIVAVEHTYSGVHCSFNTIYCGVVEVEVIVEDGLGRRSDFLLPVAGRSSKCHNYGGNIGKRKKTMLTEAPPKP